jgi:hypothetical protein
VGVESGTVGEAEILYFCCRHGIIRGRQGLRIGALLSFDDVRVEAGGVDRRFRINIYIFTIYLQYLQYILKRMLQSRIVMAAIPTDLFDLLVYILDTKHPYCFLMITSNKQKRNRNTKFALRQWRQSSTRRRRPRIGPFFAEESLGIPKKVLVKAFLSARAAFNAFQSNPHKFGISLFAWGERG